MDPLAVVAVLTGTIGTLVGVIGYLFRLHLARDDEERRDFETWRGEKDQAMEQLRRERDAWRDRSMQVDRRLDKVAGILEAAPPPVVE